jgi:hypothetical protein
MSMWRWLVRLTSAGAFASLLHAGCAGGQEEHVYSFETIEGNSIE